MVRQHQIENADHPTDTDVRRSLRLHPRIVPRAPPRHRRRPLRRAEPHRRVHRAAHQDRHDAQDGECFCQHCEWVSLSIFDFDLDFGFRVGLTLERKTRPVFVSAALFMVSAVLTLFLPIEVRLRWRLVVPTGMCSGYSTIHCLSSLDRRTRRTLDSSTCALRPVSCTRARILRNRMIPGLDVVQRTRNERNEEQECHYV